MTLGPDKWGQATLEVKGTDFEMGQMEFGSQLCPVPSEETLGKQRHSSDLSFSFSKIGTIIVWYPNVLRVFGSVPGT